MNPIPPSSETDAASVPSRRLWGRYAAVAALAALTGAGVAWRKFSLHDTGGDALAGLWAQSLDLPQGGSLALKTLQGRPLLLNFWATWCPPCVDEMPLLDQFYRENKANGWQVLGLAIDQPSAVRQFLTQNGISYPIVLAGLSGTELGQSLGNLSGGLPFSVLIDAAGVIRQRKIGKLSRTDLHDWRVANGPA